MAGISENAPTDAECKVPLDLRSVCDSGYLTV